jgi:hypothetical protein
MYLYTYIYYLVGVICLAGHLGNSGMYLYMHIRFCLCIYIIIHIYIYVCIHVYTYLNIHTCTHIRKAPIPNACNLESIATHGQHTLYINMYINMYMNIQRYIYLIKYTYIYKYINIYIFTGKFPIPAVYNLEFIATHGQHTLYMNMYISMDVYVYIHI